MRADGEPWRFFIMPLVTFFPLNHRHLLCFGLSVTLISPALLLVSVCVFCECKQMKETERVCCIRVYVLLCMHVLFLDGLQNGSEEVQDGGVAVCDNGTGGHSDLPGRVTRGWEERTTLCVQITFFFF